ncbi:MAG: OsmC family peroxiredoxin [Bacteroidetes bacterium]|nr:OsmC family peroxiredoxin [Bacteroidota bacterium]
MKSEDIRSIQAPIKQKYRDNPESAVITLKASGTIGENLSCKVNTGKAIAEAGLHPATGGNGTQLCSGDMLLEALAACAGVTLNTVAAAIDVDLKDAEVVAEGDLDFRGTLGVSKEAPVGFKEIRLHYNLTTDASDEEITTLLKLTERYCVVFQTLNQANQIQVSHSV